MDHDKNLLVEMQVGQVPGYYKIDVRIQFPANSMQAYRGLYAAEPFLRSLVNDIKENFAVSRVSLSADSILIKCERQELRKIEMWLTLAGYNLEPLKRWKNEKT